MAPDLPRVVTFDFYGTLVQWHEGLADVFGQLTRDRGPDCTDSSILTHHFHRIGRTLRDTAPFKPYREILRVSLERAMAEIGLLARSEDYDLLVHRIETLTPHRDVPAALAALRRHCAIALISNSDNDLIHKAIPNLTVEVDFVITAQEAGAYKPDPQLFLHAHRIMGVSAGQVRHVAASMALDMPVCKDLGIRAFWVNRRGERPDPAFLPYTEVPSVQRAVSLILNE